MASQGLTSVPGSGSIGRAPSLSSRMKQSCRLLNCVFLRLAQVEVAEQPPDANRASRTSGCSIWLNQPMQPGRQPPRDAVGQQEVQVLLLEHLAYERIALSCSVTFAEVASGSMDSADSSLSALYGLGAAALVAVLAKAAKRAWSCRGPSTRRWPATRACRGASPRWCRSTSTTRSTSSAPTARPTEVAARRRAGFMRLAQLYQERFPETRRLTAEAREGISDLQFTDAYRVPFQYSRFVREHLSAGSFVQSSTGVTLTDLDGNRFYDLTGSYGVNVFGYDFYKECMEQGARAGARARPGARRLSPGRRLQREAAAGDLGPRRGVVPHVRHRGGDAGGAARALSHPPLAPGALLRRLSRLVGRRAAGRRQPAAGARDLHAGGHVRGHAARAAHAVATSPACWSIRLQALHPNGGAAGDSALVDSTPHAPASIGRPTPPGCSSCARSAASAASC